MSTAARLLAEIQSARTQAEAREIVAGPTHRAWMNTLAPRYRERLKERIADAIAELPEK